MGPTLDAKYSLRSKAVAVSESDVVMRGYEDDDFVGANAEAHCIDRAMMAAFFRRVIFRSYNILLDVGAVAVLMSSSVVLFLKQLRCVRGWEGER